MANLNPFNPNALPPRVFQSPYPNPAKLGAAYINNETRHKWSFQIHPAYSPQVNLNTLVNTQGPSIATWAQGYSAPLIPRLWEPPRPQDVGPAVSLLPNTTNIAYTGKLNKVEIWELDIGQILLWFPILGEPYHYLLLRHPKFSPLPYQRHEIAPFQKEAGLTSRLETVFPNLQNVLRYLAFLCALGHPKWPSGHTPLYSDVGTNASSMGCQFLPDRCALPSDHQINHPTRCPGDIKPSYKFHGSWVGRATFDPTSRIGAEYCKVVAQVWYYMNINARKDDTLSARYGYVISDEEVVLFKRDRRRPKTVWASRGLKLRNAANGGPPDVPPTQPSGMLGLVLIHMLAANDNDFVNREVNIPLY